MNGKETYRTKNILARLNYTTHTHTLKSKYLVKIIFPK